MLSRVGRSITYDKHQLAQVELADAQRIDARCAETLDLDKHRGMAAQKATALGTRRAAPGQDIACISAEIFMVAKLENVSDTA